MMAVLTPKFQDGAVTIEQVTNACKIHGVDQLALVANRPDLIPAIMAEMGL
jgi:hypothetical protein